MRGLAIAIGTACVVAVSVLPGPAAHAAPTRAEADSAGQSVARAAAPPAAGSAALRASEFATPPASDLVAPPAEFGSDWDDPRIAAPPPAVPSTRSCTVRIVDHRFVDFTPYTGSYSAAGRLRRAVEHGGAAARRRGQGPAVRPARGAEASAT